MEKRILIANRGEIAIRIAKAIRELGHIAVGVWTDNELEPPHLTCCDEWVHLEGNSNTQTYLDQEKILKIIKENKIDAVHPGYGFLAENSEFSKKLEAQNCIFIGPHREAIEVMGDKAKSKILAREAGVPVVPGSAGEVNSADEAIKVASEIGYPVLLKAVAGGGGKGMRACYSDEELNQNFDRVKSEGQSSFGYDGVLVEKLILNPHHIEVQIIADKHENILHCYERECSIQRRHQKVIEEAPSPFIGSDENLREEICRVAVQLSQAVKYDSAGTVEFIMGEDKKFYFLEMNTRIQVEHPITEEITGVDLLATMIESALGEEIKIKQEDIQIQSHSIECRICAEDPVTLLPSPGKVSGLGTDFPQGTRFDHCLFEGYEVTPDFDPMVGKLVTTGFSRDIAIRKMKRALDGLTILGLKNNIPLHKVILSEENFQIGNYTTDYIAHYEPQKKVRDNTELRLHEFSLGVEMESLS